MGIDPRADANGVDESENDFSTLPINIRLRVSTLSLKEREKKLIPGVLSKVHREEWNSWKEGEAPRITKKNISMFELTIQVKLSVQGFHTTVTALIDTGCRVPLLVRTGLVPEKFLVKAFRPIRILAADDNPMIGGTHGCKLELILPVSSGLVVKQLRCPPLWGYECELIGSDLIIGYPYLKFNSLVVDCPSDTLRHTTLTRSSRASALHTTSTNSYGPTSSWAVAKSQPSAPVLPEAESRRPDNSPGSKVKDPSAQEFRAPSSYLDPKSYRFRTALPTTGFAVHFHQVIDPPQPLPSSPTSGLLVALPPDSSLDLGDGARTNSFATSNSHYKCPQCQRITTQPDYDCGCILGNPTLLPVSDSEIEAVQVSTVISTINQNLDQNCFKIGNEPEYDLTWWDKLHSASEIADENLDSLDVAWFQGLPETENLVRSFHQESGRQDQTRVFSHSDGKRVRNAFQSGNYRIGEPLFQKILNEAAQQDIYPAVDAFSSKAHCRLPLYWSSHSDAFNKSWSTMVLWINPPLHHLSRIVEKVFNDEARGVIIVPIRPRADWFVALLYISVHWFDLSPMEEIFEDPSGRTLPLPSGFRFRVIIFDAYHINSAVPPKPHGGFGREPRTCSYREYVAQEAFDNSTYQYVVRSAIESASPHPRAKALEAELRRKFDDVMEHPVYARDINPAIRGPFGIAKIDLKEGAKPLHKKFFRCSGEREEALTGMIKKFISRGWIVPSKSEWTSQAFVVPKPAKMSGEKQWRLVLDYRYLNSQTKDDPFPLPLIEDLITRQSVNCIWSIFDLEDGFHQMHLHPESQEYTAFVTPNGVYQWTVLPMGVKNGPAMFQRMIQWALRDLTQVLVYIDDVLVSTANKALSGSCTNIPSPTLLGSPKSDNTILGSSVARMVEQQMHESSNTSDGITIQDVDIPILDNEYCRKLIKMKSPPDEGLVPQLPPSAFDENAADLAMVTKPDEGVCSRETIERHFKDVCAVLVAFRRHRLFVKGAKMHLFMEVIKFCGHILSYGQRRAAPSKLEAVRKWTPAVMTRVTHLKQFLGLCQYYAIYMNGFAKIAVPLSRQLKNRSAEDSKVVWTDDMVEALEMIKKLMLENVVLDIPDPYKPYVLEVDSSDYAIGGVLSQHNLANELRPVAFFSRKLQGENGKGQVKWSIREKETYAIVLILQKFRSWVASSLVQIMVMTDHESLQHWYTEDLNKATSSVGRRCRWHEFLSQFNLVVIYVPGHTQKVADPLSRAPWYYPGNPDEGDATFHGPKEADEFSRKCDLVEKLLDDMPVHSLTVDYICRATRRRKRGPHRGPRKDVRSETPSPLFYREWDYSTDPKFGPVYAKLKNNIVLDNYRIGNDYQRLVRIDDRGHKICVPVDLIGEILVCYHGHGHPGAPKLLSVVSRRYCFSIPDGKVHQECLRVCQQCQICQAVKPRRGRAPSSLDFFPIPEEIFHSLCMDFLQLESCKGFDGKEYDYVLVIVCRLSGYIVAIPCRKAGLSSRILAELFLEKCVCFMGIPNTIVSDQDHLISSKFFQTLCALVGIDQHFSIIYRPKGNGRAEAAVKCIVNILRLALADSQDNWLQALPWAVFQANCLPGIILPYSPHRIVFGRDPLEIGSIPANRPAHTNISCEDWFSDVENLRKKVQDSVIRIHERVKDQYMKEFRNTEFQPGDKVWVRNSKNRTESSKLDPLWTGPCEILDRLGKTGRYKVALPKGVEDVHMDDFKPYVCPPNGKAIPFLYFKPRQSLPETDDFVIDKIMAHKIEKGEHLWKVRWRGYGSEEDTWEPASSFVGFIQQDWKRWNRENRIPILVENI